MVDLMNKIVDAVQDSIHEHKGAGGAFSSYLTEKIFSNNNKYSKLRE
jgi:hypothetical protein